MASTYSTNLGIELIGTGDQSGTWGATTNTNLGTLLEQAIAGYSTQAVTDSGTATVLTISNGASSTGRNAVIALTGALTAARVVEVPAKTKSYIFYNATTGGFAVTVKVTGQTGVSIPNGSKAIVYCDGTDVRNVLSNIDVAAITGNVGIGTVSQAYRLHVVGASAAGGIYTGVTNTDATASSSAGYLGIASGTNNYFVLAQVVGGTTGLTNAGAGSLTIQTTQAQPLLFSTTGTERMRIDSSGNVGIGVTPSAKLDVAGAQWIRGAAAAGAVLVTTADPTSGTNGVSLAASFATGSYGPLKFFTSNAEAMRIDSSGNVGIGTTSPTQKLDVSVASGICAITARSGGSTSSDSGWLIATAGSYASYIRQLGDGNAVLVSPTNWQIYANGAERVRIQTTGNLSVNTTADFGVVSVATRVGYYGITIRDAVSNTAMMLFQDSAGSTAGNIVLSGLTTIYATSSDYRLKENVQPMTTGLATVSALKPVTYDWKFDGSQGEGFIAHELAEIVPYAVAGKKDAVNKDGSVKPQSVDYGKIVPHLVAAIQELSAEIEALKAKVGA